MPRGARSPCRRYGIFKSRCSHDVVGLADARAVGDRLIEGKEHHFRRRRHSAEHEHFAHESRDAAGAEVYRGDDLSADELIRRVMRRELALDRFCPISAPKSITSLMDGFRASGNGSACTTVPTRMSMAKNSSGVAIAEKICCRKACAELLVRLLGDPAFDMVGELLPSRLEDVHVPVLVDIWTGAW